MLLFGSAVTNSLVDHNASSIATITKMDNSGIADMLIYSLGGNYIGTVRYTSAASSVSKENEVALKSDLKSCFACVRKNMVINSDGLAAGAYGCYTGSITVPNGYKTTGIHSISIGHPGVGGGLSLMTGIGRGLSGTLTIYVGYYTPRAIVGSNTDFELTLECIKDEYYTPIVTG